jgi:hypothetical protein
VPGDDLTSIPDLQDKHRRVLAEQLEITTVQALAEAEPREIHQAMRNLRPRPTFDQIAWWQDQARNRMREAATGSSDWHPAASFAVVFAQRLVDGNWERQLEIERTEVEPEQERKVWPGWDCGEICAWMREQLGPLGAADPTGARAELRPARSRAEDGQPGAAARSRAERGRLRIGSAAVIDRSARTDVVTADVVTAGSPEAGSPEAGSPGAGSPEAGSPEAGPLTDLAGPVRVDLTIAGARPDQEIHVVARVLREDAPGWNPHDPEVIKGPGRASLDLSRLPAGEHEVMVVAWAPDGLASPAVVRLPRLTIRA